MRTYTKTCSEHTKEIATYCTLNKKWLCPKCERIPPRSKFCSEHGEFATYCSIEKRWICLKCPLNKTLKETGILHIKNF